MYIIAQKTATCQVGQHTLKNINASDLTLIDDVLARHNEAWAEFLITGDAAAFREALALAADRAALLREVGRP
jgi:hypothetical protein